MDMSQLSALKSKRTTNLKKLQERAKAQSGDAQRDERIYKPKLDVKNGSNTVRLRFLPPKVGDEPLVEVLSHSFKGPNGVYYFQKSRQTLKSEDGTPEPDPVNEACKDAYRKRKATGDEAYGKIGHQFLPRSRFYANVQILKDEMQPELVGQVMIFEFGPQINKIITEAVNPKYDDVEPVDPFDLWGGADFNIRMEAKKIPDSKNPATMATVPDYSASSFGKVSEFGTDEEKIEAVNKTHDLREFIDPAKIKSFDELAAAFKKAYGKDYRFLNPDYSSVVAEAIEQQRIPEAAPEEPKSAPPQDAPWDNEEESESEDEPYSDTENLTAMQKLQRLQSKSK